MKKILIIGAGEIQVPIIEKAKEMGLFVITTDFDKNAPGFKCSDIYEVVSTIDLNGNLNVAKKYEVDGVLTTSDLPVNTVAYICEKLSLNGLSVESARVSTNKYLLRKVLKENGLKTPNFGIAYKKDELKDIIKNFKFPLVMKPIDSSASRGVVKVFSEEELYREFDESIKYSKSQEVILEEFISGNEYSVECLVQNGNVNVIAITEKTVTGEPYFVETRHIIPADLSKIETNEILNVVKKLIKIINLDNSAAHVELKMTSDGPIIIEVGARLGGDYITSDLVPLATGTSMLENIINISIGKEICINPNINKFSGIQFLYEENYERYKKYENEILLNKNLIRYEITKSKGIKLKSSLDRSGYLIYCTDNRNCLIKSMEFSDLNE